MNQAKKIWIDLDNTPHVPFFEPVIDELAARGWHSLVTVRDAFQVCELADRKRLTYTKIGRHHGRNRLRKITGLAHRAMQLASLVRREKPVLAVSHGSRAQLMLARILRVPSLLIDDYEHSRYPLLMKPDWVLTPEIIPAGLLPVKSDRVRTYPGIKEDAYAWKLQPDPRLRDELGLHPADIVVTVRPPATEAHYHNPQSDVLFSRFMDRAASTPGVKMVLLPRNQRQKEKLASENPAWFHSQRTVIPAAAVDGMNLVWHSDLVVSGGGTMNREAAALGVPVYSLFRGAPGAVDRHLSDTGRLNLVATPADADRIPLVKRPTVSLASVTSRAALLKIVDTIEELAAATLKAR